MKFRGGLGSCATVSALRVMAVSGKMCRVGGDSNGFSSVVFFLGFGSVGDIEHGWMDDGWVGRITMCNVKGSALGDSRDTGPPLCFVICTC